MSVSPYEERYVAMTPGSRHLYEEAKDILPAGVSAGPRFRKPYPLYMREARGARLIDVDGNEYIDLRMGAGPDILGHASPVVLDAVEKAARSGNLTQFTGEGEVRLAQKIRQHMPWMEMVRYANSGTEAIMFALRAAMAFTGRSKIAKFEGGYHGQYDLALVSSMAGGAGPDDRPEPTFDSAGLIGHLGDTVTVLPFNNLAACQIIRERASELGAVIMEPVAGAGMGCVASEPEFLRAIRDVTRETGIPLIFDEVITGFRLAMGGAAEIYDVKPDLAVLGKVVGGGMPIGVYGGRRDIMEKVVAVTGSPSDVREKIYQSGTFTANPMCIAAGIATITELEKGEAHPYLNHLGDRLRNGLREAAARAGVAAQVTGMGSLAGMHFTDRPVRNRRDVIRSDQALKSAFSLGMLVNGVFFPGVIHLSVAHTEADIDRVIEVAEQVLTEIMVPMGAGSASRSAENKN